MDNKKEHDPEELLSATKAGKLLGVSGKTIIRMMQDGNFPGYRIGFTWKFKRDDIERYRESRKFEGGKPSSESQVGQHI